MISNRRLSRLAALSALGSGVLGYCIGAVGPAAAQDCATQILKIHQPPLNYYDVPVGGQPSGRATAADLPAGSRVVECHKNGRIKAVIAGREVWVDLYLVQTDVVRKGPRTVDTKGGVGAGGGVGGGTAGLSD